LLTDGVVRRGIERPVTGVDGQHVETRDPLSRVQRLGRRQGRVIVMALLGAPTSALLLPLTIEVLLPVLDAQLKQKPSVQGRIAAPRKCTPSREKIWTSPSNTGGSVAEWLACWTLGRKRARVRIAAVTLSGNSLRQTVHTHRASVHQAATLVAALLRVAGVTAGLSESNGSLPPGL